MRSRVLSAMAVLALTVSLTALLYHPKSKSQSLSVPQEASETPVNFQKSAASSEQIPVSCPGWYVGIYQGRIAVFLPGEDRPRQVLETEASSLPQPDQEALASGIPVSTKKELAALLEDYDS